MIEETSRLVRDLTQLTIGRYNSSFHPPLREHVICEVAMRGRIVGCGTDAKFIRCIYTLSVEERWAG
jgi:hypothetical protein